MVLATALIDANNFYAACEQSLDPSLIGRPVVVLSNNDGCIIARSSEARALNIAMGQPYFKIRHQLKSLGVIARSSNYSLYGDMSQRLMNLIREYCERLEIYSIDEAFVELKRPRNNDLRPWARQLRAVAYQNLGLPIAIGIGSSKGQAKLANHIAKTMSLHTGIFDFFTYGETSSWLEKVDIENVWGIGSKSAHCLRLQGIYTAKQLRDMPSNQLQAKCGIVGVRIQQELQGKVCIPLKMTSTPKRETCVSRSFKHPITTLAELRQAISSHVTRASEKLREQKQRAGAITVFTNTSPFKQPFYKKSATIQLETASNDTSVLIKESLDLVNQIFKSNLLLVKAGVIMKKLQNTNQLQTNLLGTYDILKLSQREDLMKTIDNLNRQHGRNTISWASCGLNPSGNIHYEHISKRATTSIKEVPIVLA